jgi:hypothetical protein
MRNLLALLAIAVFLIISSQVFAEEDMLVVADFENHPNNLGGEVGVYGSLEPNWDDKVNPQSWYYGSSTDGYDEKNVHGGKQSFRLVNALGAKKNESWGSFSLNLGPVTDATATPCKVQSKDVVKYKYLTFWVKGGKGGEKMEVLFRDSHAPSYMPQVRWKAPDATTEWKKISVPLQEVQKLDLKSLDNVGIAFGPDVKNDPGAIVYIDDMTFSN